MGRIAASKTRINFAMAKMQTSAQAPKEGRVTPIHTSKDKTLALLTSGKGEARLLVCNRYLHSRALSMRYIA
jgi:hypothetical protein